MSFSAEMKDFLNAYKTGQTVNASRTDQDWKNAQRDALEKKTARENDPDQLEYENKMQQLNLKKAQKGLQTSPHDQYYLELIRQMRNQPPKALDVPGLNTTTPAPGAAPPSAAPGAAPGAAPPLNIPAVPKGVVNTGDASDVLNDDQDQPTAMAAATGGLIPSHPVRMYQDGGAVPADDEEAEGPEGDDEAAEARPGVLPTSAELPPGVAEAQARAPGIDNIMSSQLRHDALLAAGNYGSHRYGLTQSGAVRTPSRELMTRAYMEGHSGMDEDQMKAAKDKVDPKHELTENERNMLAIGTVYQHFANQGEGEKAARVAHQMLQYMNFASQRYAAIAAHANAEGNMSLAAQAATRSYQNVPDGKDMTITPNPDGGYFIHMTGPKGEDIVQTVVTPEQFASEAMGMASGAGFHKALLTAAGEKEQEVKGQKPPTAAERLGREKLVAEHAKTFVDAWDAKAAKEGKTDEEKQAQTPEYRAELASAAQRIAQENTDMPGVDAVRAAHIFLQPPKTAGKQDFKVLETKEGETPTVDFGTFQAKVPQQMLNNFANSQAARIAEGKKKKDEATAKEEDWNKGMSKAYAGVGAATTAVAKGAVGKIGEEVEKFKKELKENVPDELYQRGKSGIEAAIRAGMDAPEYVNKVLKEGLKGFGTPLTVNIKPTGLGTPAYAGPGSGSGAIPIGHPPFVPDTDIPNVHGPGVLPIDHTGMPLP